MSVAGVLKRAWIPLLVLAVIVGAAFTVSRVRAGSGSEKPAAYPNSRMTDTMLSTKKSLVYEVFGPAGTVADISYFDVNSDPQRVDGAHLPWSLQITATVPTVVGNVVAQGDSNSIGCRIVVNGQVKAERISNEVNAYTHCLVRGA
ncbi:MmpS family transport accessory protein [Mycobacterium sp.]|uniref:MmpS family transport accessory protein n=1 Tax=Mycobacterium sp. TaxID=1785 RepID=UPI003BB11CCA